MSVVWKRDGKRETNGMSLREVAGNLRLCYAGYDMASGTWQNAAVADQDESILIGDAAVGYTEDNKPFIFAYTNPSEDPAGLSDQASHDILMYRRDVETGEWQRTYVDTVTGRISSFDAGKYYFSGYTGGAFYPSAAFTLENETSKSVIILREPDHNAENDPEVRLEERTKSARKETKAVTEEEPKEEKQEEAAGAEEIRNDEAREPASAPEESAISGAEPEAAEETEEPSVALAAEEEFLRSALSEDDGEDRAEKVTEEVSEETEETAPASSAEPAEEDTKESGKEGEPAENLPEEVKSEDEEADGEEASEPMSDANAEIPLRTVFENAWNAQFVPESDAEILTFMEDGVLYWASGYRNNYKNPIYPTEPGKTISEAQYKIFGNIIGTAVIAYLKSNETSQSAFGLIHNHVADAEWYPVELTNVPEYTNVNFAGGAFFGNNRENPLIVYTTETYDSETGEPVSSGLYIQDGPMNAHVSLVSAEAANLLDLGSENDAAFAHVLVRNNGLYDITSAELKVREAGEEAESYVTLGTFDTGTLKPGETALLEVPVPGDFRKAKTLVIGAVGKNEKLDKTEIQSECLLEIPTGQLMAAGDDYLYRGLEKDRWTVTVSSLGPDVKRGTAVFYNSETLEAYKRFETELNPRETDDFTIESESGWLDESCPNLSFRILQEGEELNESQPAGRFVKASVIPAWAKDRTKTDYFDDDNNNNNSNHSSESSSDSSSGRSGNASAAAPAVSSGSSAAASGRTVVVNTADVNHPARDAAVLCISLIFAAISAAVLENERRRVRES